jgi:phosphoglycolate phosphatase-like HAD superfamily hydrolase
MRVIAYPNSHYSPEAEALALADIVIHSLRELPGVIDVLSEGRR